MMQKNLTLTLLEIRASHAERFPVYVNSCEQRGRGLQIFIKQVRENGYVNQKTDHKIWYFKKMFCKIIF